MSRGTDENRLYVVGSEHEMEDGGHGHNGPERGAVQDVASTMASSRAEALAIELGPPEYLQRTLGDRRRNASGGAARFGESRSTASATASMTGSTPLAAALRPAYSERTTT